MKSIESYLIKWLIPCTLGIAMTLIEAYPASAAISITVSGSWTQSIDKNNLSGGVGTDLTSTYTSAQNANLITVSGAKNKNDNWQINIRRVDTAWNSTLQIFAMRISGGSGQGSVSGGNSFIQVTQSDMTFFTGSGNLSDIGIQLRLTGASLTMQPNQYSTTIEYTVIDTP